MFPEIAHGDAKMPVLKIWPADRQCFRKIRPLACRERFLVAWPGKAPGRPRTVLFVLACTNWTLVGTEAASDRRERVVSVAPHMPEMEAEVAAVTRHRSWTRLEAAEPRTAPSRGAPSAFSPFWLLASER